MTRLRTVTACHESAARDMLDREWKPIAPPVDITDASHFPNIAAARAHYAKHRERLEKEWDNA